jgi:hypothetical protein
MSLAVSATGKITSVVYGMASTVTRVEAGTLIGMSLDYATTITSEAFILYQYRSRKKAAGHFT